MRSFTLGLVLLLSTAGCRYVADAQNTAFQETKASTLLQKYQWFKQAASQLESFKASIKVQQKRLDWLEQDRANWTRDDRQNWHQMEIEIAGIKSGYNNLASEYNSKMASENWRFCNVGRQPDGSSEPLPRDFASYIEN